MNITNNQFKRITNQFDSSNIGVSFFMKFYAVHGGGKLIDSLDSFAHLLGINFNVDTLNSNHPMPYFVFLEGNILGKQAGPFKYQHLRLKSYASAQKIIVKDFFEMLSLVDINKHITSNQIQVLEELNGSEV